MHEISIVSQAVLKENLNCEKKNGLRLFDSSRDDCFNGEDGVAGENFEDRMTSLPQASIINNSSGNSDGNLTNNNSLKMTNNNTNSSNNIGVDANGSSFLTTTTTSTDSAATTNAITSTTAASATTATVLTPAPQLAQSKLPAIDHSINGNCCAGCKESIKDKFLFKVIDMNFHQECVQCSDCSKRLNEKCFTYQGKLYCKFDYLRRFGPKCSSCNELIERSELVQRIEKENLIYHLKCFNCNDCQRQLRQGEQMHLLISPAGKRLLLCKQDFSKQQQYSSALNNSSDNNRATIGAKLEQQQQQRAYYAIGNNQAVKQESAAHELSRMKLGRASATAGQQGDSSLDGIEDSLEQEELDGDELEELDEDEEGEEVSGDDEELNGDDSNQLDTMRRILDSTNYLMSANEEHFRDDKLDDFEENEENHSGVSNNNNGAIGKKGTGKLAIGGKLKRKRRRQKQRDSCGVLTQGSKKLTHNNIGESILNGSATAANLPGSSSILASNSTIMSPATGGQLGGAGSPVGSFQQHQASSKQLAINGSNHSLSNQSSSNHSSNSSASSAISQNQSEIPANAHNHHQHQHHNHNNAHLQHHSHQHRNHHQQQTGGHKPTRVRTVLNEKQLQTLRDCYAHNPRPDALMKEQLVDLTGLSPRVIRVWFQNKRCKDKKKTILCKQMLQHEKDGRHFNGMTVLHGVQLVASSPIQYQEEQSTVSPVSQGLAPASTASATTAPGPNAAPQAMTTNSSSTNNSGNVLDPLTTSPGAPLNQSLVEMGQAYAREGPGSPRAEIHAYQPPWKELIDYAHSHASAPINNNHPATSGQNAPTQPTPSDRLNAASPRYRQLMGQIHGYSTSANETMALGNDNLAIQQQFSQTNYQQQQQQAQGADLMHNHPGNFNQVPPAQPHHLSHQFQR